MANINKELNDIKNAVYGREVRGSIHDGIKKINEEVESTTDRQDSVEAQFQSVLDETTGKDVISAPEITAARVGADNTNYPNLKERLDTEHNQLSSQLAQIEINSKLFGTIGNGVDDDYLSLQNAINQIKGFKGKLVVSDGNYLLSQQLIVDDKIVIEIKENANLIPSWSNDYTESVIKFIEGSEDSVIDNLNIEGKENVLNGVLIENTSNITINGGNIKNLGEFGIYVKNSNNIFLNNVKVDNTVLNENSTGYGSIVIEDCEHVFVDDCLITNSNGKGISFRRSNNSSLSNTTVKNTLNKESADGIYFNDSEKILVNNCHVDETEGNAIKLSRGSKSIKIVNSSFIKRRKGVGNAVKFQGAQECSIANSFIQGEMGTSVRIDPHPIEQENSYGNLVQGNTIIGSGLTTHGVGLGNNHENLYNRNNRIIGNDIKNARYGVFVDETHNTIITNNNFSEIEERIVNIRHSNNTVVNSNVVIDGSEHFIFIFGSEHTNIAGNIYHSKTTGSSTGITSATGSKGTIINGNTIQGTFNNVIVIGDGEQGGTIIGNDFGEGNLLVLSENTLVFANQTIDYPAGLNPNLEQWGNGKHATTNQNLEFKPSNRGLILRSPNGTRFLLTVDDSGDLTAKTL